MVIIPMPLVLAIRDSTLDLERLLSRIVVVFYEVYLNMKPEPNYAALFILNFSGKVRVFRV